MDIVKWLIISMFINVLLMLILAIVGVNMFIILGLLILQVILLMISELIMWK